MSPKLTEKERKTLFAGFFLFLLGCAEFSEVYASFCAEAQRQPTETDNGEVTKNVL